MFRIGNGLPYAVLISAFISDFREIKYVALAYALLLSVPILIVWAFAIDEEQNELSKHWGFFLFLSCFVEVSLQV